MKKAIGMHLLLVLGLCGACSQQDRHCFVEFFQPHGVVQTTLLTEKGAALHRIKIDPDDKETVSVIVPSDPERVARLIRLCQAYGHDVAKDAADSNGRWVISLVDGKSRHIIFNRTDKQLETDRVAALLFSELKDVSNGNIVVAVVFQRRAEGLMEAGEDARGLKAYEAAFEFAIRHNELLAWRGGYGDESRFLHRNKPYLCDKESLKKEWKSVTGPGIEVIDERGVLLVRNLPFVALKQSPGEFPIIGAYTPLLPDLNEAAVQELLKYFSQYNDSFNRTRDAK